MSHQRDNEESDFKSFVNNRETSGLENGLNESEASLKPVRGDTITNRAESIKSRGQSIKIKQTSVKKNQVLPSPIKGNMTFSHDASPQRMPQKRKSLISKLEEVFLKLHRKEKAY